MSTRAPVTSGRQDAMLSSDQGPRRWRIEDATVADTGNGRGRSVVKVTLDDVGAERMAALGEAHRGGFLAVLIDDRVVCLLRIKAKMGPEIEIDGNFGTRQAERIVRGLLGPLAGSDDKSSPQEDEGDNQPPAVKASDAF